MEKKKLLITYIFIALIILILGYPIGQAYVSNYNDGNSYYQTGDYEVAMEKYEKALKGIIPKNKECMIRINYALAICKTVQLDETDQDSISLAIETYEQALDVLTLKSCHEHNDDARQLKEDIEAEIERLKNLQESDDSSDDEEEPKEEEQRQEKEKTDTIEEKIQKLKEEAIQDQRQMEMQQRNYEFNYDSNKKNW